MKKTEFKWRCVHKHEPVIIFPSNSFRYLLNFSKAISNPNKNYFKLLPPINKTKQSFLRHANSKTTIYVLETLNLFIENENSIFLKHLIGANYVNCLAKSLTGGGASCQEMSRAKCV